MERDRDKAPRPIPVNFSRVACPLCPAVFDSPSFEDNAVEALRHMEEEHPGRNKPPLP